MKTLRLRIQLPWAALVMLLVCASNPAPAAEQRTTEEVAAGIRKLRDFAIYQDPKYYSSFPSVVRRSNGELIVAFRRAPDRRAFGETHYTHTDPNSYLMLVRSKDDGQTWSDPELLFAHPFGGSQDPCMVQLRNGNIVCTSYGWCLLRPEWFGKNTNNFHHSDFAFMGGYVLHSKDGARSWQGPFIPPHVGENDQKGIFGEPIPAFNRGAACQGQDGRLYWVVAAKPGGKVAESETHLLISTNEGRNWQYSCPVARDNKAGFNETCLYETPRGDLVAFMRTTGLDDHTAIARSSDHGASFQPWQDAGFQGHPHYALRLPDKRVLLVYGYRHQPFGIRARVLDEDCTRVGEAKEIILRDDGGSGDIGYPWATMISKHRALVVYYFNHADGPRYIAGTILEIP